MPHPSTADGTAVRRERAGVRSRIDAEREPRDDGDSGSREIARERECELLTLPAPAPCTDDRDRGLGAQLARGGGRLARAALAGAADPS